MVRTVNDILSEIDSRLDDLEALVKSITQHPPVPVPMTEPEIRIGAKIRDQETGWEYEIIDVFVQGDVTLCEIRHTPSPSGGRVGIMYPPEAIRRLFEFL